MPEGTGQALAVKGVSKDFSGVRVLSDVSLSVGPGEVLGVIGENGAGKSTLLKIVGGVYSPTGGEVWIGGTRLAEYDPQAARSLGVTLIPQEFNLVGDLAVFENIFLGQELRQRFALLDKRRMAKTSSDLLARLKADDIDPWTKVDALSAAQKQMVEIAKALVNENSRVIIMDEPTTVLNQAEVEVLFNAIRDLKAHGVAVIYVSHKLREVKAICDRVLVLRDGNPVGVDLAANLTERQMAASMVGRELNQVFPEKAEPMAETALRVEGLSAPGLLRDLSFEVRKGEVFGLAGLMGAGRTETAEALMGLMKRARGRVSVYGEEMPLGNPARAVAAGLAYLSEDRQGKGILVKSDILENVTLSSMSEYVSRWLIDNRKRRRAAERYVEEFSIRAADLAANLEFFSGGNQQKVSLAKCLDTRPKIIIFDEPTRGIDIRAKADIYTFIQTLARDGLACILISSELEEIIGLCRRVAVLHEGEITGILEGDEINEEEIMLHATKLKTSGSRAPAAAGAEGGR